MECRSLRLGIGVPLFTSTRMGRTATPTCDWSIVFGLLRPLRPALHPQVRARIGETRVKPVVVVAPSVVSRGPIDWGAVGA